MSVALSSQTYGGEHVLASPALAAPRQYGLDALRAVMTLLVVFHHTAITYGALGGWFYREVRPDNSVGSLVLIAFVTLNQAYFMGLFFLLAGYFTPDAVRRHGAIGFLKERLVRLGLPLLFFGFVLGPATIALAQTSRDRSFWATLRDLWSRFVFEVGPLWFVEALLIFVFAYVAGQALASRFRGMSCAKRHPYGFPSNGALLLAALGTGAAAFILRLVWPVATQVFGLQLGYFASYIVLFVAGCLAADADWLRNIPAGPRRLWSRIAMICGPILFLLMLLAPSVPALQGRPEGGWTLPAAVYAFWEPLVAWGLILALISAFQRRFVRLDGFWNPLTRRAYAIFIIHPPVLVGLALVWRNIEAPHLVKFAVTGITACLVCYLIAGMLLRVPGVRRII